MQQGLPPAPPKRLYDATRVRRAAAAAPSPSLCSQIGSINMAIEMHNYINVLYSGYGGSGSGANAGLLFNVEDDGTYSAITIAGHAPHAFCAGADCTGPGGYTQRANYYWDSNGVIGLDWLQPDGSSFFPVPWYNDNTGVFRWYPVNTSPTYSGHGNNPWYQTYIKWTCIIHEENESIEPRWATIKV
ncbi:hypothetical protein B0H12DRAFT_1101955 [Mycena haematopus]|nr:hypothetical protein B0H12DRAFT_1101955 [Mycena haematopus]